MSRPFLSQRPLKRSGPLSPPSVPDQRVFSPPVHGRWLPRCQSPFLVLQVEVLVGIIIWHQLLGGVNIMLLHIFDGSIDARWLELSKYAKAASSSFWVPSRLDLLVVNACSSSCFLAALCSMWMAFLVLSTWESVVNSSYSFWGEALTPWCQLRGGRSQIRSLPTCRLLLE